MTLLEASRTLGQSHSCGAAHPHPRERSDPSSSPHHPPCHLPRRRCLLDPLPSYPLSSSHTPRRSLLPSSTASSLCVSAAHAELKLAHGDAETRPHISPLLPLRRPGVAPPLSSTGASPRRQMWWRSPMGLRVARALPSPAARSTCGATTVPGMQREMAVRRAKGDVGRRRGAAGGRTGW